MNVSLKHFLATGHLGLLYAAMSADEIQTVLGAPDNFAKTFRRHRLPDIWLYGGVEVWLDQSASQTCRGLWIECMGHGWEGEFKMPTGSTVVEWGLLPYMPREEVENYLQQNNISYYQPEPRKVGKKGEVSASRHLIVGNSHVTVSFNDQWQLCAFHASKDNSSSTETI